MNTYKIYSLDSMEFTIRAAKVDMRDGCVYFVDDTFTIVAAFVISSLTGWILLEK